MRSGVGGGRLIPFKTKASESDNFPALFSYSSFYFSLHNSFLLFDHSLSLSLYTFLGFLSLFTFLSNSPPFIHSFIDSLVVFTQSLFPFSHPLNFKWPISQLHPPPDHRRLPQPPSMIPSKTPAVSASSLSPLTTPPLYEKNLLLFFLFDVCSLTTAFLKICS